MKVTCEESGSLSHLTTILSSRLKGKKESAHRTSGLLSGNLLQIFATLLSKLCLSLNA